jgi:type VI secretion system secreted protein Hcp
MFDAFMKIDGIPGDSTDENHAGWIAIHSFQHGLSQQIGGARSSGGAATAGRVDHQDFGILKEIDKATPKLFLHCCNGRHIPRIEVELCRAGEKKNLFMKFVLSDVVIATIHPSGSSGSAMPMESLSLNYGKIEWEYTATDPRTGVAGGVVKHFWDTEKNVGG